MPIIAQGLQKSYGSRTVVRGSIRASSRRNRGLVRAKWCRENNFFSLIVGLERPNSGTISFDGVDVTRMPMYRRARLGLGYLPQEPSVFRKLTVEDNLRAVLENRGISRAEQDQIVDQLLTEFNLDKVRNQLGAQLSGGERRRTEIARALALNPSFLFLDEPFAGVDPIAVSEIQEIVAAAQAELRYCYYRS